MGWSIITVSYSRNLCIQSEHLHAWKTHEYWGNLSNTDLSSLQNNKYSFWPTLSSCVKNNFISLSFETSWSSEKFYRHLISSSCYNLSISFQNTVLLDFYTPTSFLDYHIFQDLQGALKVTTCVTKALVYVIRLKLCCHLDLR